MVKYGYNSHSLKEISKYIQTINLFTQILVLFQLSNFAQTNQILNVPCAFAYYYLDIGFL